MLEIHLTEKHLNRITFTNGQGWDETHPTCEGFTLTTEDGDTVTYGIKPGHQQAVTDLPYDERQLALFVVMLNYFTSFDSYQLIKSVTWVRDKAPTLIDVLELAGIYPEKFTNWDDPSIREHKWKLKAELNKYLHVTHTTRPVVLHISGKDIDSVSLDNGCATRNEQYFHGYVLKNMFEKKPRGFTVKRDRNTTHYSIPEFLHQRITHHFGDQIDIAYMVLAVDKLASVDPGFPIKNIVIGQDARYNLDSYDTRMNYWVQRVGEKSPIAAGDLHRFLKFQVMSYTVAETIGEAAGDDALQEPLLVPPSWVIL